MNRDDLELAIHQALDAAQNALPPPPTTTGRDELFKNSALEIMTRGEWVPADVATWRSWTGRRQVWGVEFHGPIYIYGSPDDSSPYDGSRECFCPKCQQHVIPQLKPN